MASISPVDLILIGAFLAYTVWGALSSREKASENIEEYFLAGRTLKGWQAGLSMAATQFAADTPLLVMGLIAVSGVFSLWRLWIYAVAFLFFGFILAGPWRRAGVITDAEVVTIRYSGRATDWLRVAKAIYFGTLFNSFVLAMVILAATRLAEPFFLWQVWLPEDIFNGLAELTQSLGFVLTIDWGPDVWVKSASNILSLGIILAFTLFYSVAGGLRSVVKTDVAQFLVMMLATFLFVWIAVDRAGGLTVIFEKVKVVLAQTPALKLDVQQIFAITPDRASHIPNLLMTVIGLQWLLQMNADGTGYLAQRAMACRSDEDARWAAMIFVVVQVLVRSLLWLPLGFALMVLFPPDPGISVEALAADREGTYIRGMVELLPDGIKGLMLVGMVAAFSSTIDTHLNWGASYWTNDILKPYLFKKVYKREPTGRELVWYARTSTILVLVLALSLIPLLDSIRMAWEMSLMLGAGIGVPLVLRWVWWKMTAMAELASMVGSGLAALFIGIFAPDISEAAKLLLVAGVSVGLCTGVAWIQGGESEEILKKFFSRVHPPGYWPASLVGPKSSEEARADWQEGLWATIAASWTLFCLLVAGATWLMPLTLPVGFSTRWLWILALLLGALLGAPVWWSHLRGKAVLSSQDT